MEFSRGGKLSTILVTTDGSEYSGNAVREAIKLAGQYASRLVAVSVVETNPEYETLAPELVEQAAERTRAQLEEIKAQAAAAGVDCATVSRSSDAPYGAIVEEARNQGADMIVMGRRGRTGLQRLLMGSVTAKVIGHAPCNVLVVPSSADTRFTSVLAATDGSKYGTAAAGAAIELAKQAGSPLLALSVVSSEAASGLDIVHAEMPRDLISQEELGHARANVRSVVEMAQKRGVRTDALIASGRPWEAIVETARTKKADLIVIGSHGKTGMERLLMGSVAERVVGHASCSVLVIRSSP